MNQTQNQVLDWLVSGETGMSSECMAMWLAFGRVAERGCAPGDPADFDRCLRLLEAAPGLRELLPRMADVSREWEKLVRHWGELESVHLNEVGLGWTKSQTAPKTYKLMREILQGAD